MDLETGSSGANGSAARTRNDPAAALRAVARIRTSDLAGIAYGGAREGETPEAAEARLREVALTAGLSPERIRVIVEPEGEVGSALKRRAFRARVLWALDGRRGRKRREAEVLPEPVGCVAPQRARERLEDLDARWEDLRAELDRGIARPTHTNVSATREEGAESPRPTEPSGWAVVIDRFDDLGCEPMVIGGAVAAILGRRSHVVIPSEGLDTRTTQGRAVARAVLRLWELSREVRREASTQTSIRLRDQLAVYGHPPFGFRRAGDKLVPVPKDLTVVRRMKDLARSGYSTGRTAAFLNREKLTGSRHRPWTDIAVWRILRNPIYEKNGA